MNQTTAEIDWIAATECAAWKGAEASTPHRLGEAPLTRKGHLTSAALIVPCWGFDHERDANSYVGTANEAAIVEYQKRHRAKRALAENYTDQVTLIYRGRSGYVPNTLHGSLITLADLVNRSGDMRRYTLWGNRHQKPLGNPYHVCLFPEGERQMWHKFGQVLSDERPMWEHMLQGPYPSWVVWRRARTPHDEFRPVVSLDGVPVNASGTAMGMAYSLVPRFDRSTVQITGYWVCAQQITFRLFTRDQRRDDFLEVTHATYQCDQDDAAQLKGRLHGPDWDMLRSARKRYNANCVPLSDAFRRWYEQFTDQLSKLKSGKRQLERQILARNGLAPDTTWQGRGFRFDHDQVASEFRHVQEPWQLWVFLRMQYRGSSGRSGAAVSVSSHDYKHLALDAENPLTEAEVKRLQAMHNNFVLAMQPKLVVAAG